MVQDSWSRRSLLKGTGAAMLTMAASAKSGLAAIAPPQDSKANSDSTPEPGEATRAQRLAWWRAARFGMFIHFGVYSTIQRHEWVMEEEAIPVSEYAPHATTFHPRLGSPRAWARLAKQAGMKYMVLTTKHHEGFCNFDSKLTDYNAAKQGPGRDVVREYVEAARAEGMHVGFYYSLMDWHHPDGAKCAKDEEARKRFVEYTHGLIREILTNYGKIDVLWYDVAWPLDANGWESIRMNKMVFELQPEIVVNNRNHLKGDFSTPEQKIVAETGGRAWESCMTMNDSWGYQAADDDWKSSRTILRNLITCASDDGNYLLNIGPKPDGSIPEASVLALREVGEWLQTNGHTIFETDICQVRRSTYASFTRKGNTLYMHVHYWPGDYVAISGLMVKVKSAKLVKTGEPVNFAQDEYRVRLTGLPIEPPDTPLTTFAIECDAEPHQDTDFVRINKPRMGV
jgi:alpha-L-fucosidase